jgi:hypothetical protein
MPELYDYKYEIDGKIVFFFINPLSGHLSARVNDKATYVKSIADGRWKTGSRVIENLLDSQQLEGLWERHIASLIVDGEPKSYDRWQKRWVAAEPSS